MNMQPISPSTSVVNAVMQRLTSSILCGNLKPGDQMPSEPELVEQLGVGRNSVREASKMLIAMGILEVRRGHGTFVSSQVSPLIVHPLMFNLVLQQKSGHDLYELRYMFESMVMYLVVDKAEPEDLENLKQQLDKTQAALEAGEPSVDYFVDADINFHRDLLRCTRNPMIELLGGALVELFTALIRNTVQQKGGIEQSLRSHRSLLSILVDRDKDLIFSTVEKSLVNCRTEFEK